MKAMVQDRFGPPGVLRLAETGLPKVGAGEVLVRVHAAALNPADWHILCGDPLVTRLMGVGLTRPKARAGPVLIVGSWLAVYSGTVVPGMLALVLCAQLPGMDSMNSFQVRAPPVPSTAWKTFGEGGDRAVVRPLVMAR
jgi:hypothetical protein